jgi:hypothetical protein
VDLTAVLREWWPNRHEEGGAKRTLDVDALNRLVEQLDAQKKK